MPARRLAIILVLALVGLFWLPGSGQAALQPGKIYFVGVGPAGPNLCTLQALQVIKEADVIWAPDFIKKEFAEYLTGKDVRQAWPQSVYVIDGKQYTQLSSRDLAVKLVQANYREAAKLAAEFKAEMAKGRKAALLINGDPCIFSDLRWFKPVLKEEDVIVIPGLSSFNAGAALLKKELAPSGKGFRSAVILASVLGEEFGAGPQISDLAGHKTTMCFFMSGGRGRELVEKLKKHYAGDTPAAACYFIGYPDRGKVVLTDLDHLAEKMAAEKETEMVLIFVGPFLGL